MKPISLYEEDIFYSKLSEPQLISHILSFLPTRDAVRTSVLSKKWLDNWRFVTKLDFDDSLYSEFSPRCAHCKHWCYYDFYVSDKVASGDLTLCEDCSISEDALYNGGNSLSFSDLKKVRVGGKKFRKRFLEELELVLKKFTTINVPTNSVHFEHLKHLKLSVTANGQVERILL
ncbi:hypothetical protein TSUD_286550 [Trifolium subterraneum]|uniref:F-box domain-containing protein n=1 Tax=Trifolium subterraneum TaxID=3900 RepID=A0A2Z6NQS8_TRISU|nr:hypothetical protein TSUD_286550 [Trifolium subterraneum]